MRCTKEIRKTHHDEQNVHEHLPHIIILDVDECDQGLDNCNSDATCTNTVGGYNCTCNDGYIGDGTEDGNGCNSEYSITTKINLDLTDK